MNNRDYLFQRKIGGIELTKRKLLKFFSYWLRCCLLSHQHASKIIEITNSIENKDNRNSIKHPPIQAVAET